MIETKTINSKQRDSNMELLRITTITMIVVLHLDIYLLESPTFWDNSDVLRYLTLFIKSLSIISVNVFVMISGWYGIKINWTRFCGLWFQVFFFSVIGYLYYSFFYKEIPLKDSITYFLLMTGKEYGFFQSYILLYLLSPMLNLFIEKTEKRKVIVILLFFFLIQTLWGCLSWGYIYYGNGYSVVSFIGIYLIARFAKKYSIGKEIDQHYWLFIYLGLSVGGSLIGLVGNNYGIPGNSIAYSYASPLVIFSSFAFFSIFRKLCINSIFINKIAKHCFAVYLFHVNSYIMPIIILICKSYIYIGNTLSYFSIIFFACVIIIVISLLLDIIRVTLWNVILKNIDKTCFLTR